MTPQDQQLIKQIEYHFDVPNMPDLQQLLQRFRELASVDLDEVEKLVQECAYEKFGAPEDQHMVDFFMSQKRKLINYTLNHITKTEEG